MALTVSLLGVNYSIPEPGDTNYDQQLTSYLKSISTAFPQLSGGTYALTAELDLGATFGTKQAYVKSETTTPATTGVVRLAKTDAIAFRNNANSADLALKIDTGDALTFNGANVTGNPMLAATSVAGQSIPNGALTTVVFGTVERDSDVAYNSGTGVFTVPAGKGGDYSISCAITWSAALTATDVELNIIVNATQKRGVQFPNPAANQSLVVSGVVNLVPGDTIKCQAFQNSGVAKTLNTVSYENYLTLKRIPT